MLAKESREVRYPSNRDCSHQRQVMKPKSTRHLRTQPRSSIMLPRASQQQSFLLHNIYYLWWPLGRPYAPKLISISEVETLQSLGKRRCSWCKEQGQLVLADDSNFSLKVP